MLLIIGKARTAWSTKEKFTALFGDKILRSGSGFRMSVNNYVQYMSSQRDYTPLYLFDGKLDIRAPELLEYFDIPKYFKEDFYEYMEREDRPPWRWVLLGPARTGPAFHVDPYKTGAWNAIIFGKKRWTLYPPDVSPPGAGDPNSDYYEAPRPLKWFAKYGEKAMKANVKPIEFIQNAGETLYLPPGWWHQVLNLEDTLAITQNYVNSQSIKVIYNDIKKDKSFHKMFKNQVLSKRPDLKAIIDDD